MIWGVAPERIVYAISTLVRGKVSSFIHDVGHSPRAHSICNFDSCYRKDFALLIGWGVAPEHSTGISFRHVAWLVSLIIKNQYA